MRSLFIIIFWTIALLTLFDITLGEPCTFSPPCSCKSSGFEVNLEPLMQKRGKPLFVSQNEGGLITDYYLNACGEPLKVSACDALGNTATGCQYQVKTPYGIAQTSDYTAAGDPYKGTVHFSSSFSTSGDIRKSILNVECLDVDGEFQFINEEPKKTYNFLLRTRYACRASTDSSSSGLSFGSVLLIIFFVVLLIYCIGGFLFLKFVRKAQGLEMIPNYTFWNDLPFLVKDGLVFTFHKFKGPSTYEKI